VLNEDNNDDLVSDVSSHLMSKEESKRDFKHI